MTTPPRPIDYEDVDDIIGIAAEMQDLARDRMSVEDLIAVGNDLDIPEQHLKPAIAELARRRAALLEAEVRQSRRRRMWWIAGAALLAAFALWALLGQSAIGSLAAEVAAKRAQVVNVLERQRTTHAQWKDEPSSERKSAELSGAENRVRIERQRYDLAASAYNARVASFPNSLWAAIFGHAKHQPLSDELARF